MDANTAYRTLHDMHAYDAVQAVGKIVETFHYYNNYCTNDDMWQAFVTAVQEQPEAAWAISNGYTFTLGLRLMVGQVLDGNTVNPWTGYTNA